MAIYCPYCGSKFINIASREQRLELTIQKEELNWKPFLPGDGMSSIYYVACPKCKVLRRFIDRLNMFEYIGRLTDEFIDVLIRAKLGE
jgi:hypothetical protein